MAQQASSFTLSIMARYGRQFIVIGGILLLAMMFGRAFLEKAYLTYKALNPEPPPPATMGFGYLPRPVFPTQSSDQQPKEFVLDTVGKQFPKHNLPTIEVFFMPSAQANLLALDQAKQSAASLGFVFTPEKISNDRYRWRRTVPLPATLEIDILHKTFNLQVDWASSVTLLGKKLIPTPQQLNLEVKSLLRAADLMNEDIATASPQITYVKALAGETRDVNSISEADFVRVDIFRHTPTNVPTVTAVRGYGVIRVLFSGSRDQGERLLSLVSNYYPVTWTQMETYPILPASMAYDSLKAGGGFISSPAPSGKATIRKIYLAYYEPVTPVNYFQPVWVFDGDDNFRAMVPAVDPRVFAPTE